MKLIFLMSASIRSTTMFLFSFFFPYYSSKNFLDKNTLKIFFRNHKKILEKHVNNQWGLQLLFAKWRHFFMFEIYYSSKFFIRMISCLKYFLEKIFFNFSNFHNNIICQHFTNINKKILFFKF